MHVHEAFCVLPLSHCQANASDDESKHVDGSGCVWVLMAAIMVTAGDAFNHGCIEFGFLRIGENRHKGERGKGRRKSEE